MNKKTIIPIILVVLLVATYLLTQVFSEKTQEIAIQTENGVIELDVEVADTLEKRTKGLMFRENLEGGMLFIMKEPQQLSFWMKNTHIPLDIFFIDENNIITQIEQMQPCTESPCPMYSSKKPVLYALETNVNFAEEYNIKPGDSVKFS
jgi:uncharacterized protein